MIESYQTSNDSQNNDVSLRDFVKQTRNLITYLVSKWKIILLYSILGGALGVAYAFWKKTTYVAELTFVVEESKSSALGAYAGIASQFGIDLGGAGGSGVFAGENVLEFLRSRLMVEKALLSPVPQGEKNQSLADLYIQTYDLRKGWSKTPGLENISFAASLPRSSYSRQQDSILFELYKGIVKKDLAVSKPDKKLSFILVKCVTLSETFSKYFTEQLVNEATDFYVKTKTKRSKSNVDKLQNTADSLEVLLNRKTYSVAEKQDLNLNPARQVASVGTELVMRDKMVLQTMYAEVVKNLEISKLAMLQETPIIQVVDTPLLPLQKNEPSKILSLLGGLFLGGFFAALTVFCLRIYKNIIN